MEDRRQRPTAIAIADDDDITFVSAGATIHASLRAPVEPAGAAPGAVIIAGSGPTDRDGNSAVPGYEGLAFDTYRWLADGLSERGWASLRYDKITSGATGLGPYADDPSTLTDLDFDAVFVQGARDALARLAATPGIDPSRLLLVGHSEGGLIALAVADDPRAAPEPMGLALIEPAYGRIGDVLVRQLRDQIAMTVSSGAVTADDGSALSVWAEAGVAELRRLAPPFPTPGPPPLSDPAGVTAQWQALIADTVYHRFRNRLGWSEDRLDPVALAAACSTVGTVLVTCGAKDLNTPLVPDGRPGSGVAALAAAFAPGMARLVVIENMVHELRDVGDAPPTLTPADQVTCPFADQLAEELTQFLDACAASGVPPRRDDSTQGSSGGG